MRGSATVTRAGVAAVGGSSSAALALPEDCEPLGPVNERQNLGRCINTEYQEALPRLSPDGRYLYFLRAGSPENVGGPKGGEDIWYAERTEGGGWSAARNLGVPLNTSMNNFLLAVLDGGERLFLGNEYRPDGKVESGFSFVRREGAGWAAPEPIVIEGWYSKSRWVSGSLSDDATTLVLHAERDDGQGGADLYVTFRQDDGTWSEPLSLGTDLNTPAHEITPFLAADMTTLYFSSDGHGGLGGHDVFVTRRLDESWQRWSPPENLGPRINTPGFDAYFIAPEGDDFAYLASSTGATGTTVATGAAGANGGNGANGANGGIDLFRVRLREPAAEPAVVAAVDAAAEPEPEPALERPKAGDSFVLRGVYFDFDRATLRPESEKELEEVVRALKRYPEIRAEVQGHTDGMGSDAYNDRLSDARAKAVRAYLIEHGINAARLEARGYGKRVPIATNETDEGRQLNRRVELKILELLEDRT